MIAPGPSGSVRAWARAAAAVAVLFSVLGAPTLVAAHGEHGDAKPLGAGSIVSVEGYQVELLSDPSPPAAHRESRLVAKIFRTSPELVPASGGHVSIALSSDGRPAVVGQAHEMTWAGSYVVPFTPEHSGHHRVSVVIDSLESQRFEPPLTVNFTIDVVKSAGLGGATWAALGLTAAIVGLGLYAASLRAVHPTTGPLNILEIGWVRRVLTSSAFQPIFQIPMFLLMAVVVYVGFADVQEGGINLATKLTWTIWWAGIIFTFVLAGRVWCVACPFGALNEWSARLAGAWRRLPRPFRNIWWATATFVLLTWADEQLGVVRSPRVTAWIVIVFAGLAVAIGLFYERRSFCRYLCPIGGLIGLYSMTAPLELRAKDDAACRGHAEKECYRGSGSTRGCPMFEFPHAMDRNNYCTLCAECVRGCSRDNLVIRFRAFGKDLWATGRRVSDEAYLAVILSGLTLLVTAQMLTAWPGWVSALGRWLPSIIRTSLKPVTYLNLVESLVLLGGSLVVVPLVALAAAALSHRLAAADGMGVRRTFVVFGYMLVPVGLAMHLAHNLSHLLLEGGGIVPVVQRAVALYTPFSLGEPDWQVTPLAPEPVVGFLQTAIIIVFFVVSLVVGHRLSMRVHADPRAASRALVPFAVLSFVLTIVGILLLAQPMGMRHGM